MIIGTAGHIDHGKTALIQALTGVAGDRRREEQARGITIDLGYVYADLGDGGLTGFIDVPGHERFVHNMLAGASGLDLALLVVAADDGVMPQTREHLAILELLGIPRLLVALTKADRVDAERLAQVRQDVSALLAAGPFAGAPLYPVASPSGVGIPELRAALLAALGQVRQRNARGSFRLAVDRVFSVAGAGVVVTGTAFAGQVAVGDELILTPRGQRLRVRGLHAQNRAAETAQAGQRVSLNLAGERLSTDSLARGDWLVAEALHAPTTRIDVELRLLPGEARNLAHWTPVHVHLGAQDLTGRVALLEGDSLAPGATTLAQLVLNAPLHGVHGDRLVLRDQSAQRTLGGARLLDPFAPARHRRTPQRLAQLQALRRGGLEEALPELLAQADGGLDPRLLARQFNRPEGDWQLPADTLRVETRVGPRLFAAALWQAALERLGAALATFHQEQPDELGPDRDRLRRIAAPELERTVYLALLETALAEGRLQSSGPWLHLPDHRVRLTEAEEGLKTRLWPLLEAQRFDPPWTRDLARSLDQPEAEVRLLLRKLARLGELTQVVRDLFYPQASLEAAAGEALRLEREAGIIRAAAFRDALGIGRKRSIQILECLDRIGFTRRFGDERRVRPDSAWARAAEG
ncbi:selenocysteine-specific elongation factor [Pseudomonas oryzihabitans]|uniref:Selenocysteine-specific elongation factor n=1 Tax=Pseudomonas flavocrustae TaxID=2991719 RepID=A0ABT6IKP2_9PSED|nr:MULTISPECIES: selenocysteine-specific translation elongation factor [Pseudomonas]MDH4765040.1 selenocysteine-specific translation elongation factor [Pseudomonas sp. CBMAI 2609]QNQ98577.1 selenocysteine-specific translation elongation factor [Pseudomonas psychrotolerans]